jgi:hypothetical protein
MNAHRKSTAISQTEPLPLWLTAHRSRTALYVPIWTRLLRALQVSKRQAPRPMPWHHDLMPNARRIARPVQEGAKPNDD